MSNALSVLRCDNCGGPVADDDVQAQHGIATCRLCHAVLVLAPAKPKLACPDRFEVTSNRVTWRCSPWRPLGILGFMAVWLPGWLSGTPLLSARPMTWAKTPPMMLVGACFGAVIVYGALADLVNHTVATFDGLMLRVRTGPLPRHLPIKVHVSNVTDVGVYEETIGGKSPRRVHQVEIVTRTEGRRTVTAGFERRDDALFLAQELRRMLDLPAGD